MRLKTFVIKVSIEFYCLKADDYKTRIKTYVLKAKNRRMVKTMVSHIMREELITKWKIVKITKLGRVRK